MELFYTYFFWSVVLLSVIGLPASLIIMIDTLRDVDIDLEGKRFSVKLLFGIFAVSLVCWFLILFQYESKIYVTDTSYTYEIAIGKGCTWVNGYEGKVIPKYGVETGRYRRQDEKDDTLVYKMPERCSEFKSRVYLGSYPSKLPILNNPPVGYEILFESLMTKVEYLVLSGTLTKDPKRNFSNSDWQRFQPGQLYQISSNLFGADPKIK